MSTASETLSTGAKPPLGRDRPFLLSAAILALIAGTIVAVFGFQAAGYAPCELCSKERLPFYVGVAVALLTGVAVRSGARVLARLGFAVLFCLFLFSAAFGAYHAGVEWGVWPGPTDCTGSLARAPTTADFLQQLQTVKVVRCDAVAIRVLGLSLAGWNAVVSTIIMVLAGIGSMPATRRSREP